MLVEGGDLSVRNGDLYVEGEFRGTYGLGGAPFPKPAYDSGWIAATAGAGFWLGTAQHLPSSTYETDNIVVDFTIKTLSGIGNYYDGPETYYTLYSNNDMWISVDSGANWITHIRVRLWYYP
jgi:hypothetical protein